MQIYTFGEYKSVPYPDAACIIDKVVDTLVEIKDAETLMIDYSLTYLKETELRGAQTFPLTFVFQTESAFTKNDFLKISF